MKLSSKNVSNLLKRNAPDILLTSGVVCMIGGGILAVKKTPKAVKILEKNKDEDKIEKAKLVAPLYLPSVLLAGVGITQIICSRNMTNKKIAAMATAYTVSETAFKTYKEKVKTIVDEDKYEDIKREVALDKMQKDPVSKKEVIIQPKGDVLMYDSSSGRYFKGNMDDINHAVNILNKRMMSDMTISLNEFYGEIGLDPIKIGTNIGWDVEKSLIEVDTSATIADNGEPCIVLDYDCISI